MASIASSAIGERPRFVCRITPVALISGTNAEAVAAPTRRTTSPIMSVHVGGAAAGRPGDHGAQRLVGHRRAPEIRGQDHAGSVDQRDQRGGSGGTDPTHHVVDYVVPRRCSGALLDAGPKMIERLSRGGRG